MNYRNVLKVYKLERELASDDVALLNTLREMPEIVRGLFAETLGPPVKMKPTKERKVQHCVACDYTKRAAVHKDETLKDYHKFHPPQMPKSQRASGMAAQLNKNLSQQRQAVEGNCTYRYPDDSPVNSKQICDEDTDNGVHDPTMGYVGYHEFVPLSQSAAVSGD